MDGVKEPSDAVRSGSVAAAASETVGARFGFAGVATRLATGVGAATVTDASPNASATPAKIALQPMVTGCYTLPSFPPINGQMFQTYNYTFGRLRVPRY